MKHISHHNMTIYRSPAKCPKDTGRTHINYQNLAPIASASHERENARPATPKMKIHGGYHHFPIEIALLAYVCGIHEEFHGERWAITIFMGIPVITGIPL